MSRGLGKEQRAFLRALDACLREDPPTDAAQSRYGGRLWRGTLGYCETATGENGERLVCLSWVRRLAGLPDDRSGRSNLSRTLRGLKSRGLIEIHRGRMNYERYVRLTGGGVTDWNNRQSLTGASV